MKFSITALLTSAALFAIFVYPAQSRPQVFANLRRNGGMRSLALGFAAGVAIVLSGITYGLALDSVMGFKVQAGMRSLLVESASTSYANAALVVVAGCLLAPLVEELVFRGTMLEFFTKAKGMAAGGAVQLTSALFALLHFEWAALPIIFAFGCLLGALRIATASLQPCVLAHVTANVGAVGLALLAAR